MSRRKKRVDSAAAFDGAQRTENGMAIPIHRGGTQAAARGGGSYRSIVG
jgi:hypothetical protein